MGIPMQPLVIIIFIIFFVLSRTTADGLGTCVIFFNIEYNYVSIIIYVHIGLTNSLYYTPSVFQR